MFTRGQHVPFQFPRQSTVCAFYSLFSKTVLTRNNQMPILCVRERRTITTPKAASTSPTRRRSSMLHRRTILSRHSEGTLSHCTVQWLILCISLDLPLQVLVVALLSERKWARLVYLYACRVVRCWWCYKKKPLFKNPSGARHVLHSHPADASSLPGGLAAIAGEALWSLSALSNLYSNSN